MVLVVLVPEVVIELVELDEEELVELDEEDVPVEFEVALLTVMTWGPI
jgi:hypothetical protein